MKAIIGLFTEMSDAEAAVNRFKEAGFAEKNIGIMARGYFVKEQLQDDLTTADVVGKAGIGVALGATTGGLLGFLAAGVSLTLPVLGPILAAGSLVSILGGAVAGAVYGGALGVFLGLDVPEKEAQFYVDRLAEGAIMVVVNAADERAADAWALMRELRPLPSPTATRIGA